MSDRVYPFEFPVRISHFVAVFAPTQLEQAGLWYELPQGVLEKINTAATSWNQDLVFEQEDLDEIDDPTWEKLFELIKPYL